jgi:hypothetical protein
MQLIIKTDIGYDLETVPFTSHYCNVSFNRIFRFGRLPRCLPVKVCVHFMFPLSYAQLIASSLHVRIWLHICLNTSFEISLFVLQSQKAVMSYSLLVKMKRIIIHVDLIFVFFSFLLFILQRFSVTQTI